jgi:predicted ATP-dependent protease
MLKRGVRKVIIPKGQTKQISDLLQQAIDTGQLEVIEAATLKDVYTLMATDPLHE